MENKTFCILAISNEESYTSFYNAWKKELSTVELIVVEDSSEISFKINDQGVHHYSLAEVEADLGVEGLAEVKAGPGRAAHPGAVVKSRLDPGAAQAVVRGDQGPHLGLTDTTMAKRTLHVMFARGSHARTIGHIVGCLGAVDDGVPLQGLGIVNHIVEFRLAVITTISAIGTVLGASQFIGGNLEVPDPDYLSGLLGRLAFLARQTWRNPGHGHRILAEELLRQ